MNEDRREDRALAELLAEHARREATAGEAGIAAPPEPEELLAWLEDELAADDAARLERRMLADPDTARDLLDVADLAAAEASSGRPPSDVATHAGWRDFRRRLGSSTPAPTRRRPTWLGALAAGLFLATLALAAWVWTLRTAAPEPVVVANLVTLELAAGTRGDEPVVRLPEGAPLRLVLAPEERCEGYRAVLRRGGPGDAWSRTVDGLRRDGLGRVTLLLSAGPGAYSLVLSGCDPERELERHRFRVVPET